MKPLAPNSMIQNRYLIVQMIGKGGMGEVYLAVDQRLGSAVALKRTIFSDNSALASAFEREARILGRLRHPVLPKVIDHFGENGDQFLVMEHISGDDLAKRLENATEPFPVSWVMFWADQMLDALSYLHSHEPPIVHRDIKPQNLKLTDENHIVLLDFGLSKDFDSSATGASLNSASVAGYSPHFAAMEQIRGTGTDARSDIYSLSATLYQLLTNTVPSDALTRADAILGGEKDPIIPLNELNPAVSPAISEVILKGVELRQDQRFSSAGEMQKALRRAFKQSKEGGDGAAAADDEPLAALVEQKNSLEMDTRRMTAAEITSSMELTLKDEPPPQPVKQADVKTEVLAGSEQYVPEFAVVAVPEDPSQNVRTAAPQVSTKKKRSSRAGVIIAVVVGLLLIAGAAIGAGWLYLSKYRASLQQKPVLTPATSSPSPSPTADVATAPSDSNSAATEDGTANSASSQTSTGAPGGKPQPGTRNPPARSTQPSGAKPAARPKPKDDRTVILQ
jgi:serine/threonine protein kinase